MRTKLEEETHPGAVCEGQQQQDAEGDTVGADYGSPYDADPCS